MSSMSFALHRCNGAVTLWSNYLVTPAYLHISAESVKATLAPTTQSISPLTNISLGKSRPIKRACSRVSPNFRRSEFTAHKHVNPLKYDALVNIQCGNAL